MSTICLMVILSRIDVAIFSQFTAKGSNDDINSTILDVFEFISLPGVSSVLINGCIKCASAMILAMNLLLSPEKLLFPFDHFSKSIFFESSASSKLARRSFQTFSQIYLKIQCTKIVRKSLNDRRHVRKVYYFITLLLLSSCPRISKYKIIIINKAIT